MQGTGLPVMAVLVLVTQVLNIGQISDREKNFYGLKSFSHILHLGAKKAEKVSARNF